MPPFAQDKLVRVVRGAIFDVAVDIRHGSPTFGRWVGLEVSREKWNQILVPKGFAHGFLTLDARYRGRLQGLRPLFAASMIARIRFDDPAIGIDWPLGGVAPVLSEKDAEAPRLAEVDTGFRFMTIRVSKRRSRTHEHPGHRRRRLHRLGRLPPSGRGDRASAWSISTS